jgi:hypothetical protein
MPELRIHLHAEGPPEFSTSDSATVAAVRAAYPATSSLVPAHDLAAILRSAGRKHWAAVLAGEEEATLIRVVITG